MRKNDLIKLLQDVEGNPEIVAWNGFVQDYQPINNELLEFTLLKQNLKGYSYYLNLEAVVRDGIEPYSQEDCKKFYKNCKMQYELPACPELCQEDLKRGFYNKKRVLMIEPRHRGIDTWDRIGAMSY